MNFVKLRYLIVLGIIAFLIGGAIWVYDNADQQMATGTGGLPLIKASLDPIKLPPEEPGGEVMPHADSTVFAAISSDEQDPSMEGLKLPAEGESVTSTDFAGLRTGFAVPAAQEPKTESLFGGETATTAETAPSTSKYVSGLAPEAIAEPVVAPIQPETQIAAEKPESEPEAAPEAKPEPKIVEAAPEPVQEPVVAAEPETVAEPVVEAPVMEAPGETAQQLEAQEKAIIRPTSKPQPPVAAKKEDAAPVVKTADIISEDATPAVKQVIEQAKKPAPAMAAVQEVDVAPITARPPIGMAPVVDQQRAVSAPTSSGGGYVIQLSSTPSQADAERSWLQMQSMYPEALRGLSPSYKPAEVPGKGTFIRLRAGTLSSEEANARCDAIRRENPRGGGCLVLRN